MTTTTPPSPLDAYMKSVARRLPGVCKSEYPRDENQVPVPQFDEKTRGQTKKSSEAVPFGALGIMTLQEGTGV